MFAGQTGVFYSLDLIEGALSFEFNKTKFYALSLHTLAHGLPAGFHGPRSSHDEGILDTNSLQLIAHLDESVRALDVSQWRNQNF